MKSLNPLQKLIDELNQEKKLHSQLAKNAESENNRYNDNYVHFEKGVAYGFELAIEMLAKFNFWNDARTNPPKFDDRRKYPTLVTFICVARYDNNCMISEFIYDFVRDKWLGVGEKTEILYWQEHSIIPKELLKQE